ncbi:MAG: rhomboid family intramembrane serine protease [Cyclobacteriaceae bacterium]|nr:MAG: rhomboid family intramembrane serine protease [Cyclobacteriaceae bacterium]
MNTTTWILIITIATSFYAWNRREMYQKWLLNPYKINTNQEYWRFITSGFVHLNYMHLFFNMFALFFFGQHVAYYFGPQGDLLMIALYLLGIVISDIPTFIKYRNIPNYNSLGASGGVAAVVFSSIMFDPLNPIYIMFIPYGIPGFILGALYLVYSYYQGKRMADNINHDAHLYGAIFGLLFTVVLRPGVVISFVQQVSSWSL